MLAGPKGYTSQEIVDKANELKLTGDQPWDASKKASITHNIRTFEYHIAIGNLRYAHKAFPGRASLPHCFKHLSERHACRSSGIVAEGQ